MDETEAATRRRREELFDRHVVPEIPVLLRVARSLTAQPADAEDLVQDTLVRAYRAIDRFDGAHPRAWLLTILRRAEINQHRRQRPDLVREPEEQLDRLGAGQARVSPEETVLDGEFDAAIEDAFLALPEGLRMTVRLVDMDGLTYAEAARALGVPEGTVMSRLHRGRTRIRRRLVTTGVAPRRRLM